MSVTPYALGNGTDETRNSGNAWGYVDARDGAQAVLKSLEANSKGHHQYLIAAGDTTMRTPNEDLIHKCFPNTKWNRQKGEGPNGTLLSIEKAKSELGYAPEYRWEECVTAMDGVA